MFSKAQWLALLLALSATVSAAPNPDVVTVTVTKTTIAKAAYGHQEASHASTTSTSTITTKPPPKVTPLPEGCPQWVRMLVAPDLQEKVCKKLPKVMTTSHSKVHDSTTSSTASASNTTSLTGSHSTTSSTGSHTTASTATGEKHPKPTGLPAGCPKWVEDYVAAVNLNEACRLVIKEEHPSTIVTSTKSTGSSTTSSASKY